MKKILPIVFCISPLVIATNSQAESLMQVYQNAQENNPTLLKAAATKDRYFSKIDEARASLLPHLNLAVSAGIEEGLVKYNDATTHQSLDKQLIGGKVSLNQTIYNRGSWINLDISEMAAKVSDIQYADVKQTIILKTAQTYFNVLRAKDALKFTRAQKQAVKRQLEQTKQRFNVGLSAITDVHDAQANFDNVLAQEINAENKLVNSYEQLRELTGREYKKIDILNTKTFTTAIPNKSLEQLLAQAQDKNLSLLANKIAVDSAKKQITYAQTGHLPTLSLTANYNYNGATPEVTDKYSGYSYADAGITLSLPLYSGGATSSKVEQAKNAYIESSQDLQSNYRTMVSNVRLSFNNIKASVAAIRAYNQTLISAQSSLKATTAGFEVGTRTILDVLNATQVLYQAKQNLANSRYDYILNQLKLKQASGSLNEQDLYNINQNLIKK